MTLRLFDSATRQVRLFEPLVPGQVGIYVCGPTPQSSPHIGHLRSSVAFDVLRRWLERAGSNVTLVRNVTDIDDKILTKAASAGRPWWAHAYRYEREFSAAYDTLNVLAPTYEPRATGHIIEMVELIVRLVNAGHAYVAKDGCGDVYFDVRSFPEYGALTNQGLDELTEADEDDAEARRRKKDPRDFALWKGAKPGEPQTASWETPWGRGRPGWHIECSAMATRYLGSEFDIHGGGLDLRFPHHENEQAQSRAAGDRFARFWLHHAWVVQSGEKMSKSLGNVLALEVLLQQTRPAVVRYLLTAPHYRSNIEFGAESIREAAAAYDRVEGFVLRSDEFSNGAVAGADLEKVALPEAFSAAMDDDLGVPAALGVVFETVRAGNSAITASDAARVEEAGLAVRAMTAVLGLDPLDPHWAAGSDANDPARGALDTLVAAELEARAQARASRDFAAADAIRARLVAAGIDVEDTASGARWSIGSSVGSGQNNSGRTNAGRTNSGQTEEN